MFKQRFWTAILLIPLVFCGIYFANDPVLVGIIGLLVLALAWEWSALIPLANLGWKIGFIGVLVVCIAGLMPVLLPSLEWNFILWFGILVAIITYPKSSPIWGKRWLMLVVAWFVLSLFAHSLWALFHQAQGRWLLVYVLGLVWATDIGAYMFGKLWGKHRLIPQVSPGKTIEGTLGGLLLASCVALLGAWYFQPATVWIWLGQAWFLIGIAMIGDLWISMLKRRVHIKDTGHILPGHGGVLDRLDSLIATLPFFYYFILYSS
jgi:phosphatidate cytidylyltransferase